MNTIDIVFIYFGKEVPKYVFRNLKHLKKQFNSNNVIFASDNLLALKRAEKIGVIPFHYSLMNNELESIRKASKLDQEFRDHYWWKTSARILAVCEVQIHRQNAVLHLESDVVLFPEFPVESILGFKEDIAFPVVSPSQGIASMLFIRNAEAASKLRKMFIETMLGDKTSSDMTILGKLVHHKEIKISIMPTLSNVEKMDDLFNSGDYDFNHRHAIGSNYEVLGGCVDGLDYGLYFLGEDPRNSRGIKRLFQNRYETNLDLRNARIVIRGNEVKIKCRDSYFRLWSMHIHSKDIRAFYFPVLKIILRFRSFQSKYGPRNLLTILRFIYLIQFAKHLLKSFVKYVIDIVKRSKRKS